MKHHEVNVTHLDRNAKGETVKQAAEPLYVVATDHEKLRDAVISRRDDSRASNAEWEHADREVWENDLAAIQAGLDAAAQSRVASLEDVDARIRAKLGFSAEPPSDQ